MQFDTLLALLLFAFVTSITPGPNNFMLLASGVNFGFRRTLPHMLGIGVGFFSLLVAVGFGLGALFVAYPPLTVVLKALGAAYMLYLAWRIASSRSLSEGAASKLRPMTLMEAAAFQWINPKAWILALGAMSVFTNEQAPVASVLIVGAVFSLVNLPSVSTWAGFGTLMRDFLSDPRRLKWFNIAMGVALVLSLWPMLR